MIIAVRLLGAAVSAYTILVFLRVLLSWFEGHDLGKPYELISRAVDPYLDWFRRFPALRAGGFDFSPLAALAALALVNNALITIGYFGRLTVGIFLSMALSGAWSAVAFILVFLAIVIGLRFFSYVRGSDSFLPIWKAVDGISRPVLFRINRMLYGDRIVSYKQSLISALAVLIGVRVAGGILIGILSGLLSKLPF